MTTATPLMLDCGVHTVHAMRVSAVVCRHLLHTAPAPSGFIEKCSAPGDLQAWCHHCKEKFALEVGMTPVFVQFCGMVLVCDDCHVQARSRHAVQSS